MSALPLPTVMGFSLFSGIWMERSLGSTRDRRTAPFSPVSRFAFSLDAFSLGAFSLDSLPNLVVFRSPTDRLRDTLPAPACSALATGDGSSMLPKSAGSPPLPGDGRPPKDKPVGVIPAPARPPKNPPGDAFPSPLRFSKPPDAPNWPDAFSASVAALSDCKNRPAPPPDDPPAPID